MKCNNDRVKLSLQLENLFEIRGKKKKKFIVL